MSAVSLASASPSPSVSGWSFMPSGSRGRGTPVSGRYRGGGGKADRTPLMPLYAV